MLGWKRRVSSHPWIVLVTTLLLAAGVLAACAPPQAESRSAVPSGPLRADRSGSPSEAQSRPNVLLVTMDTLRADAVGVYGNDAAKTPTMDLLAQEGARFSLAMTAVPQTNPTHASIFTGMFPNRHGIFHHMASMLSPDVRPMAEILSDEGYTTAGHYSWVSFDPQYSGLERGFDTYERHTVDRGWPADQPTDWFEQLMDSKADATSDGVLSWAESGAVEPFFTWIHYNDAHWPYDPVAPYDTMFDQCDTCLDGSLDSIIRIAEGYSPTPREASHLKGLYDGEVAFADQQLGRIIGWLREKGILDNTIVIVTADHGEGFGEKGLWSHQEVLYNTASRVPLIIRYPAVVPAGQVIEAPASSIDILPTVLNILGIESPDGVEGRSLLPLILEQETGEDRAAFTRLWDAAKLSVVYHGMKLIENMQTGDVELYDLGQDPAETTNLIHSRPGEASELQALLDAWKIDQGVSP